MKQSNSDKKQKNQIEWRRNKVFELSVKGFSQAEIGRMLEIHKVTISRDISYLREESKKSIKEHLEDKLPLEYNKCISGLEQIIKEGWIIATQADKKGDTREKLQSLALIKDTYNTKMDLLTNASLLQDSIKFVEQSKQNLSNKKENDIIDKDIDIQGPAEDITTETTRESSYNQVF
jgi:hypothetical protein